MKIGYTNQYDLSLNPREMERVVLAVRIFVRDYETSDLDEILLAELDEAYQGPAVGQTVSPPSAA